jgi:hypothetical protein
VQPDDSSAHPLAVGTAGGGDGLAAVVFVRRWSLNYVIYYSAFRTN